MNAFMGAPQPTGLLGAANSGYPLTSGLLNAIGSVNPSQPTDWSQVALQLAGNPHVGPYAGNLGTVPPATGANSSGGSSGGSSVGSTVGGLLTSLAKNPSLVKNAMGLLGGDTLSPLGAQAAAATADELSSAAAPALAADTSAALAPAVGAGATAAELGTTADALAPIAVDSGTAAGAAGGAGSAASSGLLGAAGAAAIPLALMAAAAFVPDSAELTPSKIAGMENEVSAATKANGGLLGSSYTQNPNGTINPQNYQTLNDLVTLESENPEEFAKAGGTGPITQFLQSMGYSPINWGAIPQGSYGRGTNNSGHQL